MAKQIQFEGVTHSFPDDFTDDDISQALMGGGAPPKTSDFWEMGKNVGAAAEAGARTVANIGASALGFVPGQLAGDAANPDAAEGMMQSLSRGPEAIEKYVPRIFDKTKETEEKIGQAFSAATEAFGRGNAAASQIPGSPQFLARKAQELAGMDGENEARAAGELGMNLIPLPFLGKGKAKPVEPVKPVRPEGFTERFDTVRERDPALKDLSDAQIVEALEQRAKKDDPSVYGVQGDLDLTTQGQLAPDAAARLAEWQKEENVRMDQGREAATGMKDMYGFNDAKFLTEEQVKILGGEKKVSETSSLETGNTPKSFMAPSADGSAIEVTGFHGSPTKDLTAGQGMTFITPNKTVADQYAQGSVFGASKGQTTGSTVYNATTTISSLFDMRNPKHRAQYEKTRKVWNKHNPDEVLPPLSSEGFIISTTGLPTFGRVQTLARAFPKFDGFLVDEGSQGVSIAIPRGEKVSLKSLTPTSNVLDATRAAVRAMEESPLGVTPERLDVVKQEIADATHQAAQKAGDQPAMSPDKGGYKPLSQDEGRWFRQEPVDKAVVDLLTANPKGAPLVDALRVVEQHGNAFQKTAAALLRYSTLADNAIATFGDNPVRRISIESDRARPTPSAFGIHFPRSNESLVRRGYNASEILIHEAGHQIALGHISKYLGAKQAGLKAGDLKGHIETLNLENKNRFRAIEWLDNLYENLNALRTKPKHAVRTLSFDNAFKNLHEFVAEIPADPAFRKWLSELTMEDIKDLGLPGFEKKYTAPGKKNILQRAMQALKDIWDPSGKLNDSVYAQALDGYHAMLDSIQSNDQYFHFDMADGLNPATPGPKDFLPPELKHLAKYIDDKPTGKVQAPEQAIRAVESPATRSVLEMFTPDLRPWESVQKEFQGLKDISGSVLEKIGQRVVAGGKMYSWIKQHPALKWAVDTAYDAKASVESRAQELLHHPETGLSTKWQNLSAKDQASLWETIHAGKRAKKTFSAQELADRGLTSEQIDAYTNARKILDDLWTEFNAERLAKGMDPVAPVEGYWPSRWQGNWELITREKRADGVPGKILRVDRANSRGKLEKLAEKVRKDGKYDVDNVQPTPRAGELKDSFGLFNHLAEAVGRDTPEGRVLSSAMDRYAQELADSRRLFRRHYEASSGVEGYLGDTEGASSVRNAKDALRSVEGYVQDGLDWMYTQRASRELSGFLREAEGMGLKNVGAFARLYWDKLNNHEGKLAHLVNRMAEIPMESLGYDRNLLKAAGLELKSQATLLMLAYFKPIFIAAQFVQPHQFVGPLIQMMEGRLGRSSKSSMFEIGFKAHADTTSALMGSFDGKDGAFRQSAIEYLRKNRIIDPHFMETANTVLSHQQRGVISHLQGASLMAFAERYARTNAFFQFSRWLKEVEPTMGQSKVFSTAAELAEGSMVNYRRMERAQLFHDLGIVGDMASGLTTFKMNLASQLYMYMKEALVQKNPKPAMTLLSMMAIYAGAMGLPMREELDRLINYAKSVGILSPKAMTPTEALLRFSHKIGGTTGDVVRYGPFSAATGIDISPTFSAGALVPDVGQGLIKGLMPVGGKLVDVGMEAANVAGKGLGMLTGGAGPTSSDWGSLGKAALPSSAQWALERAQQNPKTGIVPNPTREMEGTIRRPKDLMTKPWIARMLSARTTKESTEVRANQQQFGTDQATKAQQDGLVEQAKKLQADGRDWTKAMKAYVDMGGDPTTFINAVRGAAIKQNTTTEERNAMDAKSRQKAEKYLRLRSMYRD